MIELSNLEYERFGVVTARAQISSRHELDQALEFCAQKTVQLLIARVPTHRSAVVQALLAGGGILADTLCIFKRHCRPLDIGQRYAETNAHFRPAISTDAQPVAALVRTAFQNYPNHYRANPRLDPQACADIYPDWACRLCQDGDGTSAWVAEAKGAIIGFLGSTIVSATQTRLELAAIAPPWRGRGVYDTLIGCQIDDDRRRGASWTFYPTQIANIPSQAAAIRMGFFPKESFHTVHRWMD
jgi:hypothetical protein